MYYNSIPQVTIGMATIFPYAKKSDAEKATSYAKKYFGEDFEIKRFRKGFIIASESVIFDTHGPLVNKASGLEKEISTFNEILSETD